MTSSHCKRLFLVLLASCLWSAHCLAADTAQAEVPEGFVSLFNGKDLAGWKGFLDNKGIESDEPPEELAERQQAADEEMQKHWQAVDHVIEFDGKGDSICTAKDYGDFELYVDLKIPPGGDSGIYLRGLPQIQIWDTTEATLQQYGAKKGSGGLWNNQCNQRFPLTRADNEVGQWNTLYVKMVGDQVTVKLNGKLVVDRVPLENYWQPEQPIPARGPIVLQSHSTHLSFRNLYVRELPQSEDYEPQVNTLAITPRDEVISLLDEDQAKGLYTWLQDTQYDDPQQVFQISDGMLHISGDGLGGILTAKKYRDYHLILEFKWGEKTWKGRQDRARDSGLLIHSTGKEGGHHGQWMPSLEVQIIEGGVGDFILVTGPNRKGNPVPLSLSARTVLDRDGEVVWSPSGAVNTYDFEKPKRVNWYGRDPDWEDKLGFRGEEDLDSPLGEWTRLDVRCEQDQVTVFVNGVKANEAFDVRPSEGRLQLQTELAEIYVRRWELWPLDRVSVSDIPQ